LLTPLLQLSSGSGLQNRTFARGTTGILCGLGGTTDLAGIAGFSRTADFGGSTSLTGIALSAGCGSARENEGTRPFRDLALKVARNPSGKFNDSLGMRDSIVLMIYQRSYRFKIFPLEVRLAYRKASTAEDSAEGNREEARRFICY
jgi:hypothetical protein